MRKPTDKTHRVHLTTILATGVIASTTLLEARKIGDPGVTFSNDAISKNAAKYPMMNQWTKAGKQGGIPWYGTMNANKKFELTPSQDSQIFDRVNDLRNMKGGTLVLKQGNFGTYKQRIRTYNDTIILGKKGSTASSSSHLVFDHRATDSAGSVCLLSYNSQRTGFSNFWLTYKARNGKLPSPFSMVNDPFGQNDLHVTGISIGGGNGRDSFIQRCYIENAGDHPISLSAKHTTVRECNIKGAYNKGGGAEGYFAVYGGNHLISGNSIEHIRHFTLQGGNSRHNVVIRNTLRQDISFHTGDGGENLIEANSAKLHSGMPAAWRPMLTVWSYQHVDVGPRNYVYHNTFRENNNAQAYYSKPTNIQSQQTGCGGSNTTQQLKWWWSPVYRAVDRCHKFYNTDSKPLQGSGSGDTFYPATNI